jgi:hypothetical protein
MSESAGDDVELPEGGDGPPSLSSCGMLVPRLRYPDFLYDIWDIMQRYVPFADIPPHVPVSVYRTAQSPAVPTSSLSTTSVVSTAVSTMYPQVHLELLHTICCAPCNLVFKVGTVAAVIMLNTHLISHCMDSMTQTIYMYPALPASRKSMFGSQYNQRMDTLDSLKLILAILGHHNHNHSLVHQIIHHNNVHSRDNLKVLILQPFDSIVCFILKLYCTL